MNQSVEQTAATLTIAHISDLHCIGEDRMFGGNLLSEQLAHLIAYLRRPEYRADCAVITGDLLHRVTTSSYPEVAELVFARLQDELDIPVLASLGNHDVPSEAAKVFALNRSLEVGGYRILTLNSVLPELQQEDLDWLSDQLSSDYGRGTVLAFHHSPLESQVPVLRGRGLVKSAELRDLLRESDVKLMLNGHYHHPSGGFFSGIPVTIAPALSYHQWMNPPANLAGGTSLSGFSMVTIDEDSVTASPLWLNDQEVVFTIDV